MTSKEELKKLEETLIQTGLKIAKRGEGALFVVGNVEYKPLVNQDIPPFKAISNPKLLESLALMDGAVIINEKGFVIAHGVMIKSKKTLKNFGTRHSAGLSAASGNNLVVIVSEEERKIKILKKGKMVMQIDALAKNVEKNISGAVKALESIGAGTVGTIGTSLLLPSLGIAFLPGVIVFGSAYYISKIISKKFK
jgi:DNA integrity scanning protein DisA with diadenylate cyclase activity